jgi:hypothetical protein
MISGADYTGNMRLTFLSESLEVGDKFEDLSVGEKTNLKN